MSKAETREQLVKKFCEQNSMSFEELELLARALKRKELVRRLKSRTRNSGSQSIEIPEDINKAIVLDASKEDRIFMYVFINGKCASAYAPFPVGRIIAELPKIVSRDYQQRRSHDDREKQID